MAEPLQRDTPMSTRRLVTVVTRPVDADWKCQRSGDCCTQPAEVIMTSAERFHLLPRIPEGIVTHWRDVEPGFVALEAHPCPFFIFNGCIVYSDRPYNCRRFGCMRPDPKTERFELNDDGDCINLLERVKTSRIAQRLYGRMQRVAQRWARAHGWTEAH